MDKLKYIRIREGISSNDIPIGADASNIDLSNGKNLQNTLGDYDYTQTGNIKTNIDNLTNTTNNLATTVATKANQTDLNNLTTVVNTKANQTALSDLTAEVSTKASKNQVAALKSLVGSPLTAATAAQMTDTSKIYVYTGDQSGYINGNWYYYNGDMWISGGVYNSVALQTDKTLSVDGSAADAKKTGDELANLSSAIDNVIDNDEINLIATTRWEVGALTEAGLPNTGYTNRLRTVDYVTVDFAPTINITITSGYKYKLYWYNGTTFVSTDAWSTTTGEIVVPTNATRMKVLVADENNGDVTLEYSGKISITSTYGLYSEVSKIAALGAAYASETLQIGVDRYITNVGIVKVTSATKASTYPMPVSDFTRVYLLTSYPYKTDVIYHDSTGWHNDGFKRGVYSVDLTNADYYFVRVTSASTIPDAAMPFQLIRNLSGYTDYLYAIDGVSLNVDIGVNRYVSNGTLYKDYSAARASVAPFVPYSNKFRVSPREYCWYAVFESNDGVVWDVLQGKSYAPASFNFTKKYLAFQFGSIDNAAIPSGINPIYFYYEGNEQVHQYAYIGEKFPFKKYGYNATDVLDLTYTGTPNDIAVYGDYLIAGINPDILQIYSISSKTKVGELTIPNGSHFNCLSFADKYASDDLFPLLYAETEGLDGLYNVIRISTLTSATIVKQYRFPEAIYGLNPQIGWDFANSKAYAICRPVDGSAEYNFFKFDLSNGTENSDGTYTPAVITSGKCVNPGIRQGSQFYNNRFYMMISATSVPYNPHIIAWDCSAENAIITMTMDELPITVEGEGLSISENSDGTVSIYVSDVSGNVFKLNE